MISSSNSQSPRIGPPGFGFGPLGEAPFVGALDAFAADLPGVWSPTARLLSGWTGDLVELDGSNIVTIYDQTGNGNHLTQANATHQPVLDPAVTAWSGLPAAVFAGNQFLDFDAPISPTSLLMGVHSTAPATDGLGRYCTDGSGFSSFFELGVAGAYGRWGNIDGQVATNFADPTIGHGLEMWYSGANSIIRIDTAEEASEATAPLASVNRVGAYAPATQGMIGSITYMVSLDTFYDITDRAAFRAALASVFPFAV